VPNDWGVSGGQLLRLNAQDGKFVPFVRDGKELPMPLPFNELLGLAAPADGKPAAPPKVRALGAANGMIVLLTEDNRLWLLDATTAAVIRQTVLELTGFGDSYPFAFDGQQVWFFRKHELARVRVADLKTQADPGAKAVVVPLSKPVESPGAIAVDDAGHVYISDLGADLQVKQFDPDGRLVKSFGKQGGRARQGVFDPSGLRYMAGLAVDAGSNVRFSHAVARSTSR